MNQKYFHLTLGPVQSFVAQARRSRDYWAGSFILSWLAGVAIASVKKQGGEISFPKPDTQFIKVIEMGVEGSGPLQGGIPNRFKTSALTATVGEQFDAKTVVTDVRQAWSNLAELIWNNDLAAYFQHSGDSDEHAKEIWQRQVNRFWEINWVLTPDRTATNLLDRRKNWRTQYAANEFGSKCMMMEGFQELSGTVTPNKAQSSIFWNKLRDYIKNGEVDLNPNEQLCALAFIKRRFARYFSQLNATLNSGLMVHGWSFQADKSDDNNDNSPLHVPSLPYLAAVPWFKRLLEVTAENEKLEPALADFYRYAKRAYGAPSKVVYFNCLGDANKQGLEGMSFYPEMATSDLPYRQAKQSKRENIEKAAHSFNQLKRQAEIGTPSPFYALLIMDGDSLGAQMTDQHKQTDISAALNAFTQSVPCIVQKYNGFLNYAGGDDVLAMLPLDFAIECAQKLKEKYDQCFINKSAYSTLSGAIQFAHIKTPLMKIIEESHALLDDVAKTQSGRDSLAIRINKPGGTHAQWHMPWGQLDIDELQQLISGLEDPAKINISNGWLMRCHDLMKTLTDGISDNALTRLIAHEYKCAGGKHELDTATVSRLIKLCSRYKRTLQITDANGRTKPEAKITRQPGFQSDGIKLIRFLAYKGVL